MNGLARRLAARPVLSVIGSLIVLIMIGTALLWLPIARTTTADIGGRAGGPMAALFTAVSAACGSGLTLVDTGTYWSGFGQGVLLVLMEVGGLGGMVAATLLALTVASRLGLSNRLLADSATGGVDAGTIRRVVRGTLFVAGALQLLAAVVLSARLWTGHDYALGQAVWYGVFHAVSAFSNTGLSLWSNSLVGLGPDPLALAVIAFTFVVGGLGFPLLLEMVTVRRFSRWSLHSRLTLIGTGVLAVLGPLAVLASEWGNQATFGRLSGSGRIIEATFAGLTPRSAGFSTFSYQDARPATRLVTDLLMLIGGGSGSTAGGIKVTTVAVLLLAVLAEVRGLRDVEALGRRIGPSTVRQAIAVVGLAGAVLGAATLIVLPMSGVDLDAVLFEVSSAFGCSGLTTGITEHLPVAGQLVIVLLTVIGRVGPIAVGSALALRQIRRSYRNPEARPVIG